MKNKPPLPPFSPETARQKVRMAEDAWNMRDPDRVVLAYTEDSEWRNHSGVNFECEFHDRYGQWFRAYGNEMWEFAENGLMHKHFASINDIPIEEAKRKLRGSATDG